MLLYYHSICDSQPLACPLADFFSGKERVENFVPNRLGNTRPGIGDANLTPSPLGVY